MNVQNFTSNSGNKVANQFIIKTDKGIMFQSYDRNIAFIPNKGKIQIGEDWDYSKTTSKYRNKFLRETKKETLVKIENGTYILNDNL